MKAYVTTSYENSPSIYFNISGRGQKDIENKVQRFVDRQYAKNTEYTIHWNKTSNILDSMLIARRDGGFSGATHSQLTIRPKDFISH